MSAVRRVIKDTATRPHSTRCRRRQRSHFLGIVCTLHSEANGSPRLAHSGLRKSSSVTYFRQPPNLPTAARRNRKCTECDTTAFGRNRMSAESGYLSTFGAETETEAEIRSTSSLLFLSTNTNLISLPYLLHMASQINIYSHC